MSSNQVYPTTEEFELEALRRGMNGLRTAEVLGAPEAVVYQLLPVGQLGQAEPLEDGGVIRLALVYLHQPTQTLGLLVQDFSLALLRDLEQLGRSLQ